MVGMRIILFLIYFFCFLDLMSSFDSNLKLYCFDQKKTFIEAQSSLFAICAFLLYQAENHLKECDKKFEVVKEASSSVDNVETLKELPFFHKKNIRGYYQKLQDLAPQSLNDIDLREYGAGDTMIEYTKAETTLIQFLDNTYIFCSNDFALYSDWQFKKLAENIYRVAASFRFFSFRIYDEHGFIIQDRRVSLKKHSSGKYVRCHFDSHEIRRGFAQKDLSQYIKIIL